MAAAALRDIRLVTSAHGVMGRCLVGSAVACGGHANFAWNHRPGIVSHRGTALVFSAGHKVRDQAASATAWSNWIHDALSATSWRKACRCSPERNLKNRDIDCSNAVGSSLSKFAGARKATR